MTTLPTITLELSIKQLAWIDAVVAAGLHPSASAYIGTLLRHDVAIQRSDVEALGAEFQRLYRADTQSGS